MIDFSYVEEVIIIDALNKENCLALSPEYRITSIDNPRTIAFINISEYTTLSTLKKALHIFKNYHKDRGTEYIY